jgi:hypothetical protein
MYFLLAKGLVSGKILEVSSHDDEDMRIKKDHIPSDDEIDYAKMFFRQEKFEFFIDHE